MLGTLADHVVMFTATPINRGADDLVSIVDLLGADNFEDEVLDVVDQVARRRRISGARMSPAEVKLQSVSFNRRRSGVFSRSPALRTVCPGGSWSETLTDLSRLISNAFRVS